MRYEGGIMFDIETNGFVDVLDRVHCLALRTPDGEYHSYNKERILEGLDILTNAPYIMGHNIIRFDIPAIQKVYPQFKPKGILRDTLTISRLQQPELRSHALKAWGKRLGEYKTDYTGGWENWSQEMEDYCIQDVVVNQKVFEKLMEENYPEDSIQLEHDFAAIMDWQMECGVHFDTEKAKELEILVRASDTRLHAEIATMIPPWKTAFTPKANNKRYGYVKGQTIYRETAFNPGSRQQVTKYLKQKYSWNPVDFTKKGNPILSGAVLNKLPYPEAAPLADYFENKKLLGMLADGDKAWLKLVTNEGKIHGYVNHNGAVTGRCTHNKPNLAQVPRVGNYKGAECRSLIYAPKGYTLVGCDASGLELRNLAHYMAAYDGGDYSNTIVESDIHVKNQDAAGLPTRDNAKTFIYAHNYGAGDVKLGSIVKPAAGEAEQRIRGRELRSSFMAKLPALQILITKVQESAKKRGFLYGLDGRKLWVRSEHRALNTLLQGAGSVIMKKATVLMWKEARDENLEAVPALHVHDETQSYVKDEHVERFKEIAADAIREAGRSYDYKCPLDAEAKAGTNWAETH